MAVLLETSKGDIVIDLYVDDCPMACKNFLKLCKCVVWSWEAGGCAVVGPTICVCLRASKGRKA